MPRAVRVVKTTVRLPEALWEAAKIRAVEERRGLPRPLVAAARAQLAPRPPLAHEEEETVEMRAKTKLPPGLYRRKKNGRELPTIHCYWYVRGQPQPARKSTGTTDVEEALRFLYARKAETGQARAQRRSRARVTVRELLDLVVKDYQDEGQETPRGKYEALNYALGHLTVEQLERPQLYELCREWRHHGVRWHKDAAGTITERPQTRQRPLSKATCNRYMAFLSRGYTL